MNKNEIATQLRDYSDHLALPLEIGEVMRKAAEALEHSLSAQDEVLTDEQIDAHINTVLRPTGTKMANFTMQKSKDDLRAAMRSVLAATPSPSLAVRAKPNADCSGDPANCPDNEGYSCTCDPMNKAEKGDKA